MSILQELGTEQGYLKCGIQGFAASGKTYTATLMAIGLRNMLQLQGPIGFFDTETGSAYVSRMIREATGKNPVGKRSRSFVDLMNVAIECEKAGVSVLIVDSVTHIWQELQDSHLNRVNENLKKRKQNPRYTMEFQDWGPVKRMWSDWTAFFLNSQLHIIFCGRAGFTYDHEKNEETGKRELIKTGTKMKAENEFGYEPSLSIEMEAIRKNGKTFHQATVLKDRYDQINGSTFENPNFETFLPHIRNLVPGSHVTVDTTVRTVPLLDEEGHDDRRRRQILLEEIQGEIVALYPGQTAKEKTAKADLIYGLFNTRSWTAVESMHIDVLRQGLASIRQHSAPLPPPPDEEIPFAT